MKIKSAGSYFAGPFNKMNFSPLFRVIFFTFKKIQLIFLHFLSFVSLSSIFTSVRVDVDQRAEKERQWRRKELPRQFTNAANARALVPKMAKTNQI